MVEGVEMDAVVQEENALSVENPENNSRTGPLHCSAPVDINHTVIVVNGGPGFVQWDRSAQRALKFRVI